MTWEKMEKEVLINKEKLVNRQIIHTSVCCQMEINERERERERERKRERERE